MIAAMTPGMFAADAVSILRMTAWRDGRPHERGVRLTGDVQIVGEASAAGEERLVLAADGACPLPNRRPAPSACCVSFRCALMSISILPANIGRISLSVYATRARCPCKSGLAAIRHRPILFCLEPVLGSRQSCSVTATAHAGSEITEASGRIYEQRFASNLICAAGAAFVATAFGTTSFAQQTGPIRIGLLPPLTGPLASPGKDMVDGFTLFWEQVGNTAGGRKVEFVTADTTCNPDQALTQARRFVLQEKVHFMVGPLCGHEGPAVAQVSKETGVPLVMDAAGADNVTKWDRTPTVVRTAVSSSQIGHPWGEYLYKELGLRNVTFIGQDYTFGHEITLGAVRTFTALGGKVAKIIWNPVGTKDYGATIAGIPAGHRRRVGAGRRRRPHPPVRGVVQLRHGQEAQDLRRLLDAPGRAAADGRSRASA